MITLEEYFGPFIDHPDATPERKENAQRLLVSVEALEIIAKHDGVAFPDNPRTGNEISGTTWGGFRTQACTEGAAHSSHKEGLAVDRYDPHGDIDKWCLNNIDKLTQCGIYIESPDSTPGWSHWTIRAPASGRRVFFP